MRGTQLVRQWKIIRMMESRKTGISAMDLAVELEAPVRSVYRDLAAIEEAGFPLYTEQIGKNSYWKLLDTFKKDFPVPLTATELMSLHMSRDLLRIFEGTAFQESIESLFAKVKASLPAETIRYIDNVSARLKVGFGPPKEYQSFREIISTISDATAQRRQVEILYTALSTGRDTMRCVDPYQVWAMNGCFYLIGHCHLRDAVRTFVMDRIKDLTVLEETFQFPKDFSLDDYLQTAFRVMRGNPEIVKVWFRSSAAQVVKERIWHPTQEIREQEDGSVVVTLEVPINYEVMAWVLGFGSAARVLTPQSLKEHIRNELEASLEGYGLEKSAKPTVAEEKSMPARLS